MLFCYCIYCPTMLRLPVPFFNYFFQYACYSSKHTDSAPSTTHRATASIVPPQNDTAATAQRQATSVESSNTAAPHLATESPEGAATFSTSLNDATFERIVSAVSQAVLSSVNRNNLLNPQPPSLTAAAAASPATTDLVEIPVVESGSALSHPATASVPVATALSNVMGEANVLQVSQSSQPALSHFHSVDVPIDANVSPKIKTKIWAHEFIDLGILLSSGAGDTRYHLSVSSPHDSSLPTLSLEPSHKPKNIPNVDSWTSAFQVFVGVYTAKFPMDAPALMKYSEVVRDLAARGADWCFYDSQFRLLRQSNPTEFPWGSTHWELWIRAQHFNNAPKCLRATIRLMPDPWFPRVSVVNLIGGLIVRAAVLNINVLNVVSFTLHCGVIFVLNSPPLNQPQTAAKSRPTNPSSN